MSAPEAEMRVRCGACHHTWVGLYLPMLLVKAATVMKRLSCPRCGETKRIFLYEPQPVDELRLTP